MAVITANQTKLKMPYFQNPPTSPPKHKWKLIRKKKPGLPNIINSKSTADIDTNNLEEKLSKL